MKRKIYAIIFTGLFVCTLLGGCSQKNTGNSSNQTSGNVTQAASDQSGSNITPAAGDQSGSNVTPAAADQSGSNVTPAAADQSGSNITPATFVITKDDKDGDGLPDTVEKTYGTNPYSADTDGDGVGDKDDPDPLYADNLISETSTTALPIEIKDARVEDNATADHLEITFINKGTEDLSNFDIYYTITDKVDTNKVEGYYQKLDGLTVKAGESVTLHFDNDLTQAGHYYGNMNGLYGTSANGLTFAVTLHSSGYQPVSFNVEKATGTAEVAD